MVVHGGLKNAEATLLIVLIALSLQAVTLLKLVDCVPLLRSSPAGVAIVGIVSLGGLFAGALAVFRRLGFQPSPTACFFAVVLWSSLVDLLLATALVGGTTLGLFYFEHGEEYFKSSWGFWALAWDGTAHYVLQLYLAFATLTGRPRRLAGLLWCGSIINSMPVLLMGAATGSFSSTIKPSTALNAPYVLAPLAFLRLVWSEAPGRSAASRRTVTAEVSRRSTASVLLWACFHALAIAVHVWRAVVSLGCRSPTAQWWATEIEPILGDASRGSHGFVVVQCLVFFFYYIPFHAWAALLAFRELATGVPQMSRELASIAMLIAGGYAQAQITSIGSAALSWRGFAPLATVPLPLTYWLVAAPLSLLPAAFAASCWQIDTATAGTVSVA